MSREAGARRVGRLTILGLVGAALLIASALVLAGGLNLGVVFAADRAAVGEPLEFEAADGDYRLILTGAPGFQDANHVARLTCTVTLADGTSVEIDGARAVSRTESDLGFEIGSFRAVPGPTTARCDWRSGGSDLVWYSVARSSSPLTWIAVGGLVLGIALLGLATLLGIRRANLARRDVRPVAGSEADTD